MTCCNTAQSNATTTSQTAGAENCACAAPARQSFRPAADIAETADAYTVVLDMPGCTSESIDVHFHDSVLSVTGKVADRPLPAGADVEYPVGDFARSFRIGTGIDTANIQAGYKLGVLTLTLPKVGEAKARRIAVAQ